MTAADLLQRIGDTLGDTAHVKTVFGDPIRLDGKTVVPVAKVAYGFGAGAGAGRNAAHPDKQGEGGGGGGGVRAYPAGALEITETTTRFVPFVDAQQIAAGALMVGAALGLLMLLRRR